MLVVQSHELLKCLRILEVKIHFFHTYHTIEKKIYCFIYKGVDLHDFSYIIARNN